MAYICKCGKDGCVSNTCWIEVEGIKREPPIDYGDERCGEHFSELLHGDDMCAWRRRGMNRYNDEVRAEKEARDVSGN